MNSDVIMVIHVPMAKRAEKPVYINNDLFGGTFRRIWEDEGWADPVIEERFDPDRTILSLSFKKKQAKKTSDKKQAKKTEENKKKIEHYLCRNGESKTNDIAQYIQLSAVRTRVILNEMDNVETLGANSNRTYRLK